MGFEAIGAKALRSGIWIQRAHARSAGHGMWSRTECTLDSCNKELRMAKLAPGYVRSVLHYETSGHFMVEN